MALTEMDVSLGHRRYEPLVTKLVLDHVRRPIEDSGEPPLGGGRYCTPEGRCYQRRSCLTGNKNNLVEPG